MQAEKYIMIMFIFTASCGIIFLRDFTKARTVIYSPIHIFPEVPLDLPLPIVQVPLIQVPSEIKHISSPNLTVSTTPLQYIRCNSSVLEETIATATCTLRVCTENGSEVLLDMLFALNSANSCSYDQQFTRKQDVFHSVDASQMQIGSVSMYPDRNFTDTKGCRDWFFSNSATALQIFHQYINQRIPTSGISTAVMYSSKIISNHQPESKTIQRYLVIYAAATVDEYSLQVTNFTLRRLRADLGNNTFIIVVDAVPSSQVRVDVLSQLADVILFADFVSPEAYYDSVAMQEGMLEAFRLFGLELLGFYGLLIMNDSIIGPISDSLATIIPTLPANIPTIVAIAVWPGVVISGSGILVNRAAFSTQAFTDFWRYVRIPCGKWGSMLLWEGIMHTRMLTESQMHCYTLTNDIMALNLGPADWEKRGLNFYKHRNNGDSNAVLRYISEHDPNAVRFNQKSSIEPCKL
jgi:hypothetical protein